MPYLKIQTNKPIDTEATHALLSKASQIIAKQLGKPESYVMVAIEPSMPMLFAGSNAPLGYLELKSIGLPQAKTVALSEALCNLMQEELGIAYERVYIEFADIERVMWGWKGGPF